MGVMVKNKVARFLWTTVYICLLHAAIHAQYACEYNTLYKNILAYKHKFYGSNIDFITIYYYYCY